MHSKKAPVEKKIGKKNSSVISLLGLGLQKGIATKDGVQKVIFFHWKYHNYVLSNISTVIYAGVDPCEKFAIQGINRQWPNYTSIIHSATGTWNKESLSQEETAAGFTIHEL